MTIRMRKTEARQGERSREQERVLIFALLGGFLSLGLITAAVILIRPFTG